MVASGVITGHALAGWWITSSDMQEQVELTEELTITKQVDRCSDHIAKELEVLARELNAILYRARNDKTRVDSIQKEEP